MCTSWCRGRRPGDPWHFVAFCRRHWSNKFKSIFIVYIILQFVSIKTIWCHNKDQEANKSKWWFKDSTQWARPQKRAEHNSKMTTWTIHKYTNTHVQTHKHLKHLRGRGHCRQAVWPVKDADTGTSLSLGRNFNFTNTMDTQILKIHEYCRVPRMFYFQGSPLVWGLGTFALYKYIFWGFCQKFWGLTHFFLRILN